MVGGLGNSISVWTGVPGMSGVSVVRGWRWVIALTALLLVAAGSVTSSAQANDNGGGFDDVDAGSPHSGSITELAEAGVFAGTECGERRFCPGDGITRRTFAVWLVRVLDGGQARPSQQGVFDDVDADAWEAPYITRLAELGVTTGCSADPPRFCPDRVVSRAQMATFLVRSFLMPQADPAGFTDVDAASVHAGFIDRLAAADITQGCATAPLRFCPSGDTTRAQMASFLARAIKWRERLPSISSFGLYAVNAQSGVVTELIVDASPNWRISPDGSRVVYGGDEGIFLADSDGTSQVKLASPRPHFRMSWYPDSSGFVYTNEGGTFEVDAASHRQTKILDAIETGRQSAPLLLLSSSSSEILYSTDRGVFSLSADRTTETHLIDLTDSPYPYASMNRLVDATHAAVFRPEGFAIAEIGGSREWILTTWTDDPSEWTWVPLHPRWSPDGTRIAFYSNRGSYIADIQGNDPVRVSDSPGYYSFSSPDWSDDGRYIAFGVSEGLVVTRSDGSGKRVLTTFSVHGYPKWSPDGTKISYTVSSARARDEQGTYVTDLNTGDTYRIGDRRLTSLAWSPDGSRIAYNTYDGWFVADPDGGNPEKFSGNYFARPRWSPGGRFIAYNDDDGFFVIDSQGMNRRRLSHLRYQTLDWADDDRQLAFVVGGEYVGTRRAPAGLLVVDVEGGTPRRLADAIDPYGVGLTWLPDGETFYFAAWEVEE